MLLEAVRELQEEDLRPQQNGSLPDETAKSISSPLARLSSMQGPKYRATDEFSKAGKGHSKALDEQNVGFSERIDELKKSPVKNCILKTTPPLAPPADERISTRQLAFLKARSI